MAGGAAGGVVLCADGELQSGDWRLAAAGAMAGAVAGSTAGGNDGRCPAGGRGRQRCWRVFLLAASADAAPGHAPELALYGPVVRVDAVLAAGGLAGLIRPGRCLGSARGQPAEGLPRQVACDPECDDPAHPEPWSLEWRQMAAHDSG